jgi:hypothetical protein
LKQPRPKEEEEEEEEEEAPFLHISSLSQMGLHVVLSNTIQQGDTSCMIEPVVRETHSRI